MVQGKLTGAAKKRAVIDLLAAEAKRHGIPKIKLPMMPEIDPLSVIVAKVNKIPADEIQGVLETAAKNFDEMREKLQALIDA